MKIIISPAKKINDKNDFNYIHNDINLNPKTIKLYNYLKSLEIDELAKLLNTSKAILKKSYDDLHKYNLEEANLTAIFAYDGIQYKYMSASVLDDKAINYLNEHLLILSAIYGASRPLDLIVPHRLEMQAKSDDINLYDYWHDTIAKTYIKDDYVINLASNEYAKAVISYLNPDKVINISFKEMVDHKLVEKGVYVKMARGAMVRYLATNQINELEDIKSFNDLNYEYSNEYSTNNHFIFTRKG